MEQATISRPAAAASRTAPPRSRLPALAQAVRYARDPLGFLTRFQRRYGDVFVVSFPYFGRIVYVAEPELVKEVFTGSPAQFHAGEANATVLEPALGPNSVLTLDDEPHMRQRKLLLPPFHGERIERYGELMREITLREMESWPVGEPFALRPHTQRITLAVIMRAVFGVHDEQRLVRFGRLIEAFAGRVNAITAFPVLRRHLGPWSPWTRFVRAREALDEFIYEEIALRRAAAEGEAAGRDDVLSLLLSARHDDGSPMSDEEMRDELVTVLGAGHETTATALAWAMERLLRNPAVLARLRDSIAAGEDDYLDATIKETLRARPVIVDVARKLTAPARIGGYDLPAGTFVLPAIAALHYREDLFPDPEEFRPERFLDGRGPSEDPRVRLASAGPSGARTQGGRIAALFGRLRTPHRAGPPPSDVRGGPRTGPRADTYAWIPFGGGVRRCIGAAFAEYEMRIVLRAILERADLSAPDPKPERVKVRNITLAPGKGARVSLDRPLR